MNVLEITVDLGPGASPVLVETLVRGVRVVADVGRDATLRRIRRAATEQMKFPTDDELVRAVERLPDGSELSVRAIIISHDSGVSCRRAGSRGGCSSSCRG